ncbi:ParA family protein [Flavobacterium sp. HSC-61S13]|uniref:ParA family protein n=1 Tax=Flavobacterium sp. HSC-61S13 TaxID=2910963 RepID=UPI0020A14D8F|nr:AAA family ATPase [Flavobacterium sp. HSC-61S13]MCP1994391.1 cellulose biosynthesis protein BcsQ [Flavobacterium sp. HSC-61S13]
METVKQPLNISFYTQKGGVGKSTMTTLLASLLHYSFGYNVLVMDCDFPQHSLANMRERDKENIMQNEIFKQLAIKQFQTLKKKAYLIIKCKAEEALEKATALMNDLDYKINVVFFDLPGTVNTKGVLSTLNSMDFIFSPLIADRLVVESTLSFTKAFMGLPKDSNNSSKQELWLFWNQVDGREKTELYDSYHRIIKELEFPLMQSRIKDSKRFRKETETASKYVFRSSLLAANPRLLKVSNLTDFVQEFLTITKLKLS